MSEQEKKGLVPEKRFPEFLNDGVWKEYQLDEVASFSKGKGISKSDVVAEGKLPCIRYGELYTVYGETISEVLSRTNVPAKDLVLSKANDVIIPASGETQEDIATASCVQECGVALGGDLNIIRSKNNGVFLSYYLNSAKKKDIAQMAQGISVIHLYATQLKNLDVHLPEIEEQQKIADCLTSIDELATAHTQNLDALKRHKKGLMQQLFPAEGEAEPKLRFPEFRGKGEWKEKTLDDVCDMQAGKFVRASEIKEESDGKFPCYGGNGLRGFTNTFTHNGKYSLIGRQGALCGNVALTTGQFHATEHAVVVTPNEGVSTDWLHYMLHYLNLNRFATGQAQPGLSVENLKKVELKIAPEEDEQQKIADCLSAIDELITTQSQKVEALKAHKKGLMQQLFPSMDKVAV